MSFDPIVDFVKEKFNSIGYRIIKSYENITYTVFNDVLSKKAEIEFKIPLKSESIEMSLNMKYDNAINQMEIKYTYPRYESNGISHEMDFINNIMQNTQIELLQLFSSMPNT